MKFDNDTQAEIYNTCVSAIEDKLEKIITRSRDQSALDAACYMIYVLLHNPNEIKTMTQMFYPEDSLKIVRDIFLEIHDLLQGKRDNHTFIHSVADKRFFTPTGKDDKSRVQKIFISHLRQDLVEWLDKKYTSGVVKKETLMDLNKQYKQLKEHSRIGLK